jgi:hypothetical protein
VSKKVEFVHHRPMKVVTAVAASLSWASTLLAAPSKVLVEVSAVEGCITQADLASRLEQALARRRSPAVDEVLRVRIEAGNGLGFVAHLGLSRRGEASRERRLESSQADCRQLDAALVLVATTLLDDEPRAEPKLQGATLELNPRVEDPTPPVATTDLARRQQQHDVVERRATATTRSPLSGSAIFGAGGVAVGVLSQPTMGVRVDSRIKLSGPFTLWLGTQVVPPSAAREVDRATVEFATITGRAAGCWSGQVSARFAVDGCGGLDAGVLVSRGQMIRGEPNTVRPLLWPIGVAALSMPIWARFVARVHVAGGPALIRQKYFITDSGGRRQVVREAGPALWESGIGLGFLLP